MKSIKLWPPQLNYAKSFFSCVVKGNSIEFKGLSSNWNAFAVELTFAKLNLPSKNMGKIILNSNISSC